MCHIDEGVPGAGRAVCATLMKVSLELGEQYVPH